jgi:hypothetical protein
MAPELSQKNFSGGPDIIEFYGNCEKLSVDLRCNRINKKRNYNPQKGNIDAGGYSNANR